MSHAMRSQLNDARHLEHYGIGGGSLVHLVSPLSGGGDMRTFADIGRDDLIKQVTLLRDGLRTSS